MENICEHEYQFLDIEMHKLCFMDITEETDVTDSWSQYQDIMDQIKIKKHRIKVLHCTIPVTAVQHGIRVPVKAILNRKIGRYDANTKRYQCNMLKRKEYLNKGVLFDLARLESTRSDGGSQCYKYKGESYESHVPSYSYDGAHLNAPAQMQIAEKYLEFILKDRS